MNQVGYDAMALGIKELSLGPDVLRQRMDEAQFPLLSANVEVSGSGELVAPAFVILEMGGRRLGVIGLTPQPDNPLRDFRVLDPQQAAAQVIPQVAAQADTVVVLTSLTYRAGLALAEAVPGIDLLIAALPMQLPEQAVRAANTGTLVVVAEQPAPAHTGRRIGRLAVTLETDGSLGSESWTSVWMDNTLVDDLLMATLLDSYRP
jgi:5'-nucleotidase/UDP-sugar diphosphatase